MDDTVLFGEIIEGDEPEAAERQEQTVRRKIWRTMRRAARQIPFMEDVIAGYYCAVDRSTPARVRTALLGALAYFVLPVDMIPDFIIGTGFADDATILLGTLALVRAHITPAHRAAAERALADELGETSA
jgi:uncharacterized membrane protein YkvA (DUF1232 family)